MTDDVRHTWQVETESDTFQRVLAQRMRIDSGCVVFYRHDGWIETIELAFAPGQWLTVCEDQ